MGWNPLARIGRAGLTGASSKTASLVPDSRRRGRSKRRQGPEVREAILRVVRVPGERTRPPAGNRCAAATRAAGPVCCRLSACSATSCTSSLRVPSGGGLGRGVRGAPVSDDSQTRYGPSFRNPRSARQGFWAHLGRNYPGNILALRKSPSRGFLEKPPNAPQMRPKPDFLPDRVSWCFRSTGKNRPHHHRNPAANARGAGSP